MCEQCGDRERVFAASKGMHGAEEHWTWLCLQCIREHLRAGPCILTGFHQCGITVMAAPERGPVLKKARDVLRGG